MKKKMLISVFTALVLVLALGTAALADSTISESGAVKQGDKIAVTINTTATGGFEGTIDMQGLAFESVDNPYSSESVAIIISGANGGKVIYTCRVTAAPGETVSFGVKNAKEQDADTSQDPTDVTVATWTATVQGGSQPSQPSQPTDQPSPSGSASAAPSASAGQDDMPKTGDAAMDLWTLAVIAAACGAVAIVAGKKVFSHK